MSGSVLGDPTMMFASSPASSSTFGYRKKDLRVSQVLWNNPRGSPGASSLMLICEIPKAS